MKFQVSTKIDDSELRAKINKNLSLISCFVYYGERLLILEKIEHSLSESDTIEILDILANVETRLNIRKKEAISRSLVDLNSLYERYLDSLNSIKTVFIGIKLGFSIRQLTTLEHSNVF